MSDDQHDEVLLVPPALRHLLKPGEVINDSEIERFELFLERREGETSDQYARRVSDAGLAVVMDASDAAHDFPALRNAMALAEAGEVPVLLMTSLRERPVTAKLPTRDDVGRDAREAAALKALADARAAQQQAATQT